MSIPFVPSSQPYYGEIYPDRNTLLEASMEGQINPSIEDRYRRIYGRYLSGFGESMDYSKKHDPTYRDQHVYELESMDDVNGSGLFDDHDRIGTSNVDTGIFESNYSLPGNVAREVPYLPSRDTVDVTDGSMVVHIPGGGLPYMVDRARYLQQSRKGTDYSRAMINNEIDYFVQSSPISQVRVPEVPAYSRLEEYPRMSRLPYESNVEPYTRPKAIGFGSSESQVGDFVKFGFAGLLLGITAGLFWELVKK